MGWFFFFPTQIFCGQVKAKIASLSVSVHTIQVAHLVVTTCTLHRQVFTKALEVFFFSSLGDFSEPSHSRDEMALHSFLNVFTVISNFSSNSLSEVSNCQQLD